MPQHTHISHDWQKNGQIRQICQILLISWHFEKNSIVCNLRCSPFALQVDGMFQNMEGYAGCKGKSFSAGSVVFGFTIKILYKVRSSVVTGVS